MQWVPLDLLVRLAHASDGACPDAYTVPEGQGPIPDWATVEVVESVGTSTPGYVKVEFEWSGDPSEPVGFPEGMAIEFNVNVAVNDDRGYGEQFATPWPQDPDVRGAWHVGSTGDVGAAFPDVPCDTDPWTGFASNLPGTPYRDIYNHCVPDVGVYADQIEADCGTEEATALLISAATSAYIATEPDSAFSFAVGTLQADTLKRGTVYWFTYDIDTSVSGRAHPYGYATLLQSVVADNGLGDLGGHACPELAGTPYFTSGGEDAAKWVNAICVPTAELDLTDLDFLDHLDEFCDDADDDGLMEDAPEYHDECGPPLLGSALGDCDAGSGEPAGHSPGTCVTCDESADCDYGDACLGTGACSAGACVYTSAPTCTDAEVCDSSVGCRERSPYVATPESIHLDADCADQGGGEFAGGAAVTLVFEDATSGRQARVDATADASGTVSHTFGLGCTDVDAQAAAAAFIEHVDPSDVGFEDRPMRYWAEYVDGGVSTSTPVVEYSISYAGSCASTCGTAECGVDACGLSCGSCDTIDACLDGVCEAVTSSMSGLSVSGSITGTTTWTRGQSPILVTGDVNIYGTLDIDDGVVVMFQADRDMTVKSGGRLYVHGEADSPVLFTSDGATAPGSWGGLHVTQDSGEVELHHMEFRYGGDGSYAYPIEMYADNLPDIADVRFSDNTVNALTLIATTYASNVELAAHEVGWYVPGDLTIAAGATLTLDAGAVLKFDSRYDVLSIKGRLVAGGNPFDPAIITAATDDGADGVDTTQNGATSPIPGDWGGVSMEYDAGQDPSSFNGVEILYGGSSYGAGCALVIDGRADPAIQSLRLVDNGLDALCLDPLSYSTNIALRQAGEPYYVDGDLSVGSGATLTLGEGVALRFDSIYDTLAVQGALVTEGTAARPVILTSAKDDDVDLLDATGDGATSPLPGDWGGMYIEYNAGQPASRLDYLEVRYGADSHGVGYAFRLDPRNRPTVNGLYLHANDKNGVALDTDDLSSNTTLSDIGWPYTLDGTLDVTGSARLTIGPGVTIKFESGYDGLAIQGGLDVQGTATDPVVLTAQSDDLIDGIDVAGDGEGTCVASTWGGVDLAYTVGQPSSTITGLTIACAGSSHSESYPMTLDPRVRPTIDGLTLDSNRLDVIGLRGGTYSDVHLSVDAAPLYVDSTLTVSAGHTLTIDSGVVLRFEGTYDGVVVDGSLDVEGTPEAPVVFTAANDDARGGDIAGDGVGTASAGSWEGISLTGTGTSEIHGAVIAYGGSSRGDGCGLSASAGSLVVDQTIFEGNDDAVCVSGTATADLGGGAGGSVGDNTWSGHADGSGSWAVWLDNTTDVYAYDNDWGDGSDPDHVAAIVYDQEDDGTLGEVLFNRAPEAVDMSVVTDEDTTVSMTLGGTDPDGSALSYTVTTSPGHGTLSGTAPDVRYAPSANFYGSDSFKFKVSDGRLSSSTATVAIRVDPVNDAPTATNRSATTDEDAAVAVTLSGSDVDGDALTWTISAGPGHGTVELAGTTATYRPDADYAGTDVFLVAASDGTATSADATVTITVRAVDDAPTAAGGSFETDEDVSVWLTAVGSDLDTATLTWLVVADPAHGTLVGTGPEWEYVPDPDFNGSDSATVVAYDGSLYSDAVALDVLVRAVNDAPEIADLHVDTDYATPVSFTVVGSDVDGDTLTWRVATAPSSGDVSGSPPSLTYAPADGFEGDDALLVAVSDGTEETLGTIDITVASATPPTADAQTVTLDEDGSGSVVLTGSDPEGDALTWSVVTTPEHGTLTGVAPSLSYAPAVDFNGTDSFTFTVSDGRHASAPAAVTLLVVPQNDAPTVSAGSWTTPEDMPLETTVDAVDVDGDPLEVVVLTGPSAGELSFEGLHFTYVPAADAYGADSAEVVVTDGVATSGVVELVFDVEAVEDAPVAADLTIPVPYETATVVLLTATDADGDALSYALLDLPSLGTLSGAPPDLVYTPGAGVVGTDSFRWSVSDGEETSTALAVLEVATGNHAPEFVEPTPTGPLSCTEGDLLTFTVAATDADGTTPTLTIDDGPEAAAFDPSTGEFSWTPTNADVGTWVLTLSASDGVDTTTELLELDVAASTDTGSTDTGSTDTGSTETGSTETGSTDTGSTETGSTETGSTETGSTETGSTDTGSTDTGPIADTNLDESGGGLGGGGTDTGNGKDEGDSCGCAAAGSPSSALLAAAFLGSIVVRRRRP